MQTIGNHIIRFGSALTAGALFLLTLFLPLGCAPAGGSSGKPVAVATIFAYYDILRSVGGDKIDARILLPRGESPHEFDPPASAKITVSDAALVVKNGLGIDPWIDKLAADSSTTVLDVSKDVDVLHTVELPLDGASADTQVTPDSTKAAAPAEEFGNPHIWLDPAVQMAATQKIREALIKIDPADKDTFQKNAEAYLAQLRQLDADYRAAAGQFHQKEFIGFHSAYDYLAHRYGLTQVASLEEIPGSGITPAQADRIIQLIQAKHIKVIFIETALDPKSADLIIRETGVKTAILQPLETYDSLDDTYVGLMRQNLENLKKALQ